MGVSMLDTTTVDGVASAVQAGAGRDALFLGPLDGAASLRLWTEGRAAWNEARVDDGLAELEQTGPRELESGVGHYAHHDDPERFAELLERFWAGERELASAGH